MPTGLPRARTLVSDAICRTGGQYEALRFVVRRADGDRIPSGSKTLNRVLTAGECRTTDDEIEWTFTLMLTQYALSIDCDFYNCR